MRLLTQHLGARHAALEPVGAGSARLQLGAAQKANLQLAVGRQTGVGLGATLVQLSMAT